MGLFQESFVQTKNVEKMGYVYIHIFGGGGLKWMFQFSSSKILKERWIFLKMVRYGLNA